MYVWQTLINPKSESLLETLAIEVSLSRLGRFFRVQRPLDLSCHNYGERLINLE